MMLSLAVNTNARHLGSTCQVSPHLQQKKKRGWAVIPALLILPQRKDDQHLKTDLSENIQRAKPLKILNISLMLTFTVVLIGAASCREVQSPQPGASSDAQAEHSVLQAAKQVIEAIRAKDGKRLAMLVHPEKGVRFSPSAYVDIENDVVFSSAQVSQFWIDRKTYTWGFADGTGDAINMTPSEYCDRYIMDRDFLNPSSISVNNDRARGNTNNNAASVYPQGTRVEYYIEPAPGEGTPEFDWAALRLVFERSGDTWFLVAVIHDEWTT
jgi:hypothetical protein